MSSTFFSGMHQIEKPSSKVLRPPGGVTTDIFAGEMPSTPRNGKNRMASNIFSVEKDSVKNNGDQPRRAQKSVDSHNRLFGQSERPFTPAKNHMKSNIAFGHNGNLTNGKTNGHHLNGNSDSGSLSSSTSSIASSNDNYKMNGYSKTDSETEQSISNQAPAPPPPPSEPIASSADNDDDTVSLLSSITVKTQIETGRAADSVSMTSKKVEEENKAEKKVEENTDSKNIEDFKKGDFECKAEEEVKKKPSDSKKEKNESEAGKKKEPKKTQIPVLKNNRDLARNPITGVGMESDNDNRPRKNQAKRDGNPITGEGYKGAEINTSIPSLNGANQVINKNRIPPGGFSSGLW